MKMRLTMRIGVLLVGALVTAALQLPAADFPTTARDKADKVVVLKSERKLVLMN